MRFFKQQQEKGFTLVEMLVVAPIVILAIGGFLTVIISMTGEVLASRASNNLSYNVQDALNHIDQDVKLSSSFMATDNIPTTQLGAAQGYNDDSTHFTNVGGTSGTSLILNMNATDSNPISNSSSYVFLKNQPNACASPQSNTVGNKPLTYTIVYFVKNGNLYRRVMMPKYYKDTTNTVCAVPWQEPSCSSTYMDAQSGSVFCQTRDDELVDGVGTTGFNVQYYNGQSATMVNTPASDTSNSDPNRNTALQSATTVGISIDATQSAGGRTVERNAVLRTSRLDGNASAIASITADGAPAAPAVTASVTEPTYATFKWTKVPLATGYTIKYQISGNATWFTGFSDTNAFTYTVTTSGQNDTVTAQVTAINDNVSPSLTSAIATAKVTIPQWISPGLLNSWSNYNGTYAQASYTKTPDGFVVMKGLITRAGTFVNGEDLFILPPGYRPEKQETFQVESNNGGASVQVATNGEVTATTGISAAWVSLVNISFLSATSPHNNFVNLTLQSSWTNRLAFADDPQLAYTKDAVGRYIIRGTIAGGTNNNGTLIATLPSDATTTKQSIYPVRSGSGGDNGAMTLAASSGLGARGVAVGSAYFMNFSYFPDSYTGTWNTLVGTNGTTLNSGWVNYSTTYNSAQYTKSSDNIVTLRGLIKSGTASAGTVFATLPVGYRPSARLIFAADCNDVNCRIDVDSDGTVVAEAGVTATWVSLDKIYFMAEQ